MQNIYNFCYTVITLDTNFTNYTVNRLRDKFVHWLDFREKRDTFLLKFPKTCAWEK